MSLRVWLPLNGTLDNQGLDDVIVVNNGATVDNSGKIGKCYNFNGNNSYISLSGDILYSIIKGGSQPFSIAMWVYHADDSRAILFGDYGLDGKIDFNIELTAAHEVRFYWSNNPSKVASSTIMTQNTWNHLVIIYDGTKIVFYKNGLKTSDIYNNKLGAKTKISGDYYLGRDFRTGTTALNGKINDVRIYDHALSPLEVKQISQGLILHYPLNNNGFGQENLYGNGGDCTDLSGLNNYGNKFSVVVEDNQICAHATGALKNTAYLQSKIPFTPEPNEEMTFSAWVKIKNIVRGTTNPMCGFYFSGQTIDGSWRGATKIKLTVDGIEYSVAQAAWDKAIKDTKWHKIICSAKFGNYEYTNNILPSIYLRDCTGDLYIHHIKYQRGTIATPWCPNSADELYNKLGLNDNIQYDTSGYGNNGTRIGTFSWISDTPRYSVSTAFEKGIISIPNSFVTTIDPIFSISLWFKLKSGITYTAYTDLISFSSSSYSNQPFRLELCGTPVGKSIMWFRGSSGQSGGFAVKRDISTDEWYHTVLVSEGNKQYSYYINGEKLGTYNGSANSWTPTGNIFLGENINGVFYESDVRIYMTALSADDVKSLYNNSAYIDNQGNIYGAVYEEV